MKSKKDFDKIARIEREISKKYGKEAIQNPHSGWDEDKELLYTEQTKKLQSKLNKVRHENDMVEVNGFLMPRKLINIDKNRTCPVCDVYSFHSKDDWYMNKYECCYDCYIQWVDGREERWMSGWRPNEEKK